MGLYVVRRLVEVHGGQLALHSHEGTVTAEVNVRAAVPADSSAPRGAVALPRPADEDRALER
jgi:signal transduction histidine kinase